MSVTLYLVIEDEDGTHLREWGLNNSEDIEELEEDAKEVLGDWYVRRGQEAWEVE